MTYFELRRSLNDLAFKYLETKNEWQITHAKAFLEKYVPEQEAYLGLVSHPLLDQKIEAVYCNKKPGPGWKADKRTEGLWKPDLRYKLGNEIKQAMKDTPPRPKPYELYQAIGMVTDYIQVSSYSYVSPGLTVLPSLKMAFLQWDLENYPKLDHPDAFEVTTSYYKSVLAEVEPESALL